MIKQDQENGSIEQAKQSEIWIVSLVIQRAGL